VRKGSNLFRIIFRIAGAVVALWALHPIASLAADGGEPSERARQAGEDRWVPSLAIASGVTIQQQDGTVNSFQFEDGSTTPTTLRGVVDGDDLAVSPFVGGALELMSPALAIPTRPRFFASGEILPTFASNRSLAIDGDPGCIRSPEPGAPCARDQVVFTRTFSEAGANGQGSRTSAELGTLVYGATVGVAFPLQVGKRQLRIKPSFGWINYEINAEGFVSDAACSPTDRCVTVGATPGFLREVILSANDSQRFNGIGPGLDIEMDTGRYGPLGVSLFLGGRAYAIVGDRTLSFATSQSYDDVLGMDVAQAQFEVEVDPWLYRAHVGIRFHWLGSAQ